MLSFLEWSGTRKALDHPEELTHNGRSEQQQPEETQAVPVPAPNAPPTQVKKSHINCYQYRHILDFERCCLLLI